MKSKFILLSLFLGAILFFSFSGTQEISKCFISFTNYPGLITTPPIRLPETSGKFKNLTTENGDVQISRIDGYSVLYKNSKNAVFLNLSIELSTPESYGQDTTNIISNLKLFAGKLPDVETKNLVKLDYNGYIIYGISRYASDSAMVFGTFVMFPGNNTTVYFYFDNIQPDFRETKNLEDYKIQRNGFLGNYTNFLRRCPE